MKFKKLLGTVLISISLYFLAPNVAKAEEFKINLKNKEITTEQTDKTKKGNICNDLDLGNIIQNTREFFQRTNERVEKRIYEERFLLDVSPETRSYLFNWENATRHMNDVEKKFYMDKVDKDVEKIVMKGFREEAQGEFKDSRFYEWFKEELGYYRKRIRETFRGGVKIREKEAYIDSKGDINFSFKKEELKNVPEEERFKLRFKKTEVSVGKKEFFEFNIKAKPFSFHNRDYKPGIDFNLITKYVSLHGKTSYKVREEELKTSVSTTGLPKGLVLSFDYNRDNKDETNSFETKLSKDIKGYNLGLSYIKTHDNKNRSDNGTIMFTLDKTW